MKGIQKTTLAELQRFLQEFQLSAVLQEPELKIRISKSFKRYYPLLLLEKGIDNKVPWCEPDKVEEFRLYFRETISDICQALILACAGFYKPAHLSLRSSVENWVKCIGISQDQKVLTLKSVFELIELVGALPAVKDHELANQYYNTLRQRYKHLCGFVHTSNVSHMALTTAAGAFPRYLPKDADAAFTGIEEVCSKVVALFCVVAEGTYRGLHHTHFDIVSDELPKKLKKRLNS